jgi:hypothetical protein
MINPLFTKLVLSSSIALALAACGSDNHRLNMSPEAPAGTTGDVFALTASNKLLSFNRDTPASVRTSAAITGLQGGENLVGIDYRPADGLLYAVAGSGRIYTINTSTGAATFKATLAADAADTTAPFTGLAGTEFGLDFNPVADRLRVVSNTGQSLRINVDTGATTTDGGINGGAAGASVTASAYTNSLAGTGSTTLYAIDSSNDTLYVQNPPNNGTLSAPVALGVDAGSANGFDIDARTNTGYALATVGGARNLYSINLAATANAATLVGALGVSEDIRGIALRAAQSPHKSSYPVNGGDVMLGELFGDARAGNNKPRSAPGRCPYRPVSRCPERAILTAMMNKVCIPANCHGSSLNEGALRAPVVAGLLCHRNLAWLS